MTTTAMGTALRPTPRPRAGVGGPDVTGRPGRRPQGPAGTRPDRRADPTAGQTPRSLRDLASAFALLYLEIESGRRPPRHATRLMEPRLAAQLAPLWVRPGDPGQVIGVTGQRTAADAFEAVAVVRRGRRIGALALQLRRRGTRWLVTEAIRPEDGPLPEPPFGFPAEGLDAFDLAGAHEAACAETGPRDGMPLAL